MRQHILQWKLMNILLFPWIIFLRFMSYLLWCSSFKKLLYTKLKQMLWGFSRTWPFLDTCSRTRVIGSEASPVFLGHPLLLNLNKRNTSLIVFSREILITSEWSVLWAARNSPVLKLVCEWPTDPRGPGPLSFEKIPRAGPKIGTLGTPGGSHGTKFFSSKISSFKDI